jgi:leucyl/phenylalanyl-tRNA--protein transferase
LSQPEGFDIQLLDEKNPLSFPDPRESETDGFLAVSRTLGVDRLIHAYRNGIFPWMKMDFAPFLWCWFSPDPRMLLFPGDFKIPRSLKKAIREKRFEIKVDHDFRTTIESCSSIKRAKEESTWIESDMIEDYVRLHEQGIAHSVEAYQDGKLAGGLYGLSMGNLFFGESMFHLVPEASKACLAKLVEIAKRREFDFIDCQVYTEHLESMGAREVERSRFLDLLKEGLSSTNQPIDWKKEAQSS